MKRNILGSAESRILLMDGAMGTMIQSHDLSENDYRGEQFNDHNKDLKSNNIDNMLLNIEDFYKLKMLACDKVKWRQYAK